MDANSTTPEQAELEKHPLVGAGLHMKDEAGLVKRQATIVAVIASGNRNVGDLALVQYLDWITGTPAFRQLVALHELTAERWALYASADAMQEHYERVDAPRAREAEQKKTAEATHHD
jgi:hypothetical protein